MGEGILHTPSLHTTSGSAYSPSMSSVSAIIRNAIRFPLRNKKLMLQVFILVLFPSFILVLLHSLVALPLIGKVEDSYENSTPDHQDLVSLALLEIPFAFAFSLLLIFTSYITVSASVSIYQGTSLGLKETLLSIKSTWKMILVSGLYFSFLLIAFVGITIILTRLTALVGVFAALTYPYLASFSAFVLVISILEDEYCGEKAFRRAKEIIKQGGFQVYFLMLMLILLSLPVYVVFYVTSTDDDDANGLITQFGFLLVATALFCLTNIFNYVVYTVFCLDYKQRNGENIEVLQTQFHSVPTAEI